MSPFQGFRDADATVFRGLTPPGYTISPLRGCLERRHCDISAKKNMHRRALGRQCMNCFLAEATVSKKPSPAIATSCVAA